MRTSTAVLRRAPVESAVTVEWIDDFQRFTSLRVQWAELQRASAADNPFLTWEWLHAWWTHLRGTSRLRILAVRAGESLIAIAPLRVSPGVLPWLSRLEFLGTGCAGSDYLDLIVRRGYEAESLDAIGRALRSQMAALGLGHLPADSLTARLATALAADGWACWASADGTCPVVQLSGHSWDSYLATLGSSHRANVRRRLKGLDRQFEMHFDQVSTELERSQMLARLIAFHVQRWGARGSSAFQTPEARAFQNDVTRRALASGWLRMYVLRLNRVPVAIMYGFAHRGRFYFYQHGFDTDYQEHGVGLVLMGLTIRAAIEDGAREFDMLWGLEPYKFLWASERHPLQRIELFPASVSGRLHQSAAAARRHVATLTRRMKASGVRCAT